MSHSPASPIAAGDLRETLRSMVSVLQGEREALSSLDLDTIMGCAYEKNDLCGRLAEAEPDHVDEECRGLLDAARRLNEVNRQLRNLIAANVSARLEAIAGGPALYRARANAPAYAYAGGRG